MEEVNSPPNCLDFLCPLLGHAWEGKAANNSCEAVSLRVSLMIFSHLLRTFEAVSGQPRYAAFHERWRQVPHKTILVPSEVSINSAENSSSTRHVLQQWVLICQRSYYLLWLWINWAFSNQSALLSGARSRLIRLMITKAISLSLLQHWQPAQAVSQASKPPNSYCISRISCWVVLLLGLLIYLIYSFGKWLVVRMLFNTISRSFWMEMTVYHP